MDKAKAKDKAKAMDKDQADLQPGCGHANNPIAGAAAARNRGLSQPLALCPSLPPAPRAEPTAPPEGPVACISLRCLVYMCCVRAVLSASACG